MLFTHLLILPSNETPLLPLFPGRSVRPISFFCSLSLHAVPLYTEESGIITIIISTHIFFFLNFSRRVDYPSAPYTRRPCFFFFFSPVLGIIYYYYFFLLFPLVLFFLPAYPLSAFAHLFPPCSSQEKGNGKEKDPGCTVDFRRYPGSKGSVTGSRGESMAEARRG